MKKGYHPSSHPFIHSFIHFFLTRIEHICVVHMDAGNGYHKSMQIIRLRL
ncbi:hypothetical protein EDO6_01113 [Paenibacillus xylanexedens]|nr:hypothetical protein EDO6_01113 [Paenibacillus xylanexedens]